MASFLGMDSTSTTSAEYAGSSDQSVLPYKSKDFQLGQINLKGNAWLQEGGINLSKINVGNKGTFGLTLNDPSAMVGLGSQFGSTVSNLAKDALDALGVTAADATSGGDASRNKIILWVVLGVLGLVAAIFYFRR